jgi:hypothetical protein
MGVSLSLEGPRQARVRRRGGQHTRTAEEQACLDAFAAFLNADALSAGRSLSRVSKSSLASRLLPAARALARAADLVLASDPAAISTASSDFVLSPACLLGLCEGSASFSPCQSLTCQHECHLDAAGSPGLHGPVLAGPVLAGTVLPEPGQPAFASPDSAGSDSAVSNSAVSNSAVSESALPRSAEFTSARAKSARAKSARAEAGRLALGRTARRRAS